MYICMLTLRTHMKDNLLFLKGHHVDFHQTFLVQVIHREILKVFFFFRSLLVILHDTYILIVNVPIIYKTNFIQTFFFYFCPNYFKVCHHHHSILTTLMKTMKGIQEISEVIKRDRTTPV